MDEASLREPNSLKDKPFKQKQALTNWSRLKLYRRLDRQSEFGLLIRRHSQQLFFHSSLVLLAPPPPPTSFFIQLLWFSYRISSTPPPLPSPMSSPNLIASKATVPSFTSKDYISFFGAGALCCTITHAVLTPLDVVKTRIQIDAGLKGHGMLKAAKSIVAAEGPKGLLTGFGPTAVGYLAQGGAKFAGYEYWKKTLVEASGGYEAAVPHRTAIYLTGAA